MKNSKLIDGGWQANVEYHRNYVIKTPKTKKEIRNKIAPYYKKINKPERIEEKISKLKNDWENSIRIVKSGRLPLRLLANPQFLHSGEIKQERVEMLSERIENLMRKKDLKSAKKLVDKVINFIILLWGYGVHEITFKFYSEMGIKNDKIVLVDIGELTDDKEIVKRQLLKGNKKLEDLRKHHHDEVLDYYQDQIAKKLTIKKLDQVWNSKKASLT